MAKYEYELIEEKKKHELSVAIIVAVIIPVVMFIIGILWGINQLNTNPQSALGKAVQDNLCEFCFQASLLPNTDTANKASNVTPTPEEYSFTFSAEAPSCIDKQQPIDFRMHINANKSVGVSKIILYTPVDYKLTKVQDLDTNETYEFTTQQVTGANTVHIIINKEINKLNLQVNGQFTNSGQFNLLPIIQLIDDKKYTLPTMPFDVKDNCNAPAVQTVTPTATPTTEPQNTETQTTETENTNTDYTSPENTTQASTTVPETGLIDTFVYVVIGIAIGIFILRMRKLELPITADINNLFTKVYTTAGDIFARTLGYKVYKEKKLLDKILTNNNSRTHNKHSNKTNSQQASSPN